MIRLACTQCKAQLVIDDAFAGGACRCQHCGAIQTVPKKFKGNADTNFGTVVVQPEKASQRSAKSDPQLSSGTARLASPQVRGSAPNSPAPPQATSSEVAPPPPRPISVWERTIELQLPVLIGIVLFILFLGIVIGRLLRK
jgi:hypothetical protein